MRGRSKMHVSLWFHHETSPLNFPSIRGYLNSREGLLNLTHYHIYLGRPSIGKVPIEGCLSCMNPPKVQCCITEDNGGRKPYCNQIVLVASNKLMPIGHQFDHCSLKKSLFILNELEHKVHKLSLVGYNMANLLMHD